MIKLLNLEQLDKELQAGLAGYVGFSSPREKDEYGNLLPVNDEDIEIFLQGVGGQRKPTEAEQFVINQIIAAHDHLILTDTQRARIEDKDIKTYALTSIIANMTPVEAASWIEKNVIDLPSAKNAMQIMAKILAVLIRELKKMTERPEP